MGSNCKTDNRFSIKCIMSLVEESVFKDFLITTVILLSFIKFKLEVVWFFLVGGQVIRFIYYLNGGTGD